VFAALLLATSTILNLDVGQAYQVVAQVDCKIGDRSLDMNGAASTVSMNDGKKNVSLLFVTKWPWAKNSKIGVLAIESGGGETNLEELTYNSDYVPIRSNGAQLALSLMIGEATYYLLTPRSDPKAWLWDYEESSVLVHGAIQRFKGTCELKEKAE
jgi:hypothetical protein